MSRARFIVGTGRCGSTLLGMLLAGNPGVLNLSEFFSAIQPGALSRRTVGGRDFWALLSTPREAWTDVLERRVEPPEFRYPIDQPGMRFTRQSGVPPIACVCLPTITDDPDGLYSELERVVPAFSECPIGTQYRRIFEWLSDRLAKRVWIERSGGSLAYARELSDHFANAKFLHVYRSGPETAISMSRHLFFVSQVTRSRSSLPHGSRVGAPDVPGSADDTWVGHHRLDIPSVARFGLRWSAMILMGTTALSKLPRENVKHLSFEQLIADPEAHLRRATAFFDLPPPQAEVLECARSLIVPPRPRRLGLDPSERERLEHACAAGEVQLRAIT